MVVVMLEPMRTRSKTLKASDEGTRIAKRRERNRQSAADSRERKKEVHDEMALELEALRAENAELRRLLGGGVSAVEYEGYTTEELDAIVDAALAAAIYNPEASAAASQ